MENVFYFSTNIILDSTNIFPLFIKTLCKRYTIIELFELYYYYRTKYHYYLTTISIRNYIQLYMKLCNFVINTLVSKKSERINNTYTFPYILMRAARKFAEQSSREIIIPLYRSTICYFSNTAKTRQYLDSEDNDFGAFVPTVFATYTNYRAFLGAK